jgi:glucose/arabinose dehydrogenase
LAIAAGFAVLSAQYVSGEADPGNGYEAKPFAKGLAGPSSIAVHPASGELYVAERDANRISVLRDGQRTTVIDSGFVVNPGVPKWALRNERDQAFWTSPVLSKPVGMAFAEDGRLFVTEDAPASRLLEFTPDARGRYSSAQVVPIPWLNKEYAWSGLTVAGDGRLFIAGAVSDAGPGLLFGSVLMRDPGGEWWVVDYGPFSGFSSLCLSKHQDVLVISDGALGSVTWWDTVRHKVIATSAGTLPASESVCLLPNGKIVVAQTEREAARGTPAPGLGRLMGINPETQEQEILVSGLEQVSSIAYAPGSRSLFAAQQDGTVLELTPRKEPVPGEYYLRRSLYTFEMAEGMAPKQWPSFMKEFVSQLGVTTSDELAVDDGKDRVQDKNMAFTVREFTDRIPMIAGRVTIITDTLGDHVEDPVEQLDFVVFYPGRAVVAGRNATPSLSLFSARHASGKVERTQVASGFSSLERTDGNWKQRSSEALVYFPMTSCTTRRQPDGVNVTLAFLGMGHMKDYYLELRCGRVDKGHLMVEGESGRLADYDVAFTEIDDTGEEVRNIMIAGFDPEQNDSYTWLYIGKEPIDTQLQFSEKAGVGWLSYRMADFRPLYEKQERALRMAQWMGPSKPQLISDPDTEYADDPAQKDRRAASPQDEKKAEAMSEEEEQFLNSWTSMILTRAINSWQDSRL